MGEERLTKGMWAYAEVGLHGDDKQRRYRPCDGMGTRTVVRGEWNFVQVFKQVWIGQIRRLFPNQLGIVGICPR